jgi:acetate kinase
MGGVDVIVFTGGVGENDAATRYLTTCDMEFMGVDFDQSKNEGLRGKEAILTTDSSRVTVMVVPTNEELVIAIDTYQIVTSLK